MATLASGDTGLATFQEISVKFSFSSAPNPLLHDGYSNLPTYSVFTEERKSLPAKNCIYINRARHWRCYFFPRLLARPHDAEKQAHLVSFYDLHHQS